MGVRQNNEDLMKIGEEKAEAPGPGRRRRAKKEKAEWCGEREKDTTWSPLPGHMQEGQKRAGRRGRAQ